MKRTEYNHDNLQGPDVDIETSLKEYGIAWIETGKDILFYYGIEYGPEEDEIGIIEDCYIKFDFCVFDKGMDFKEEFDWVEWDDVASYIGADNMLSFDDMAFTQKISDLVAYYGYDSIFGSSYWEGLEYKDIVKKGI